MKDMFKKLKWWLTDIHCEGNWLQRTLLYCSAYGAVFLMLFILAFLVYMIPMWVLSVIGIVGIFVIIRGTGFMIVDTITGFAREKTKH